MHKICITYCAFLLLLILYLGNVQLLKAQNIKWHSFEEALAIADTTNQPILVDVWAPWCGWCYKMKEETYPALTKELSEYFIFTRLNRDDHTTTYSYQGEKLTSMRLAQKLNAQTVPTVVLLSADGDYLLHISEFLRSNQLETLLTKTKRTITPH